MKKMILVILFMMPLAFVFAQKQGYEKIDSMLKALKVAKMDTNKVNLLIGISNHFVKNNADSAFLYAKLGLDYSSKLKWKKGLGESYCSYGTIYRLKSDFPNALDNNYKALKIFEELKDKSGIAKCLNNIGSIYRLQKKFPTALDYHFKALKIAMELGDEQQISSIYKSISRDYIKSLEYERISGDTINLSEYNKALEYTHKSLEIDEKLNSKNDIADNYINIAIIYRILLKYDQAAEFYLKGIDIYKQLNNKLGISANYHNLSLLHYNVYEDSLNLKSNKNNKSMDKNKLFHLNKTIEYSLNAIPIAEEVGALNILYKSYNLLYLAHKEFGNYKKAIIYYELHNQFKDSVFNIEKTELFAKVESQRETQLKEKEIEKLNKENEKQQIIKNYLILISILGLVFSLIIFYFFSRKKKDNKVLEEQKAQINNTRILLEQLINNLPAHIYLKDSNLKYLLVNKSYSEVLQLPINEIIGKSDKELNQPEIYEKIDNEILQTKQRIQDFEFQHTNKKKEIFWTSTIKVLYNDIQGNTKGIIGIVQDITKRKIAEQALKESEEKFNSIVTNANEGIFIVQNGVFKFVNRHGASLIGSTPDDILEKEFTSFIHIDDRERILNNYKDKLVVGEEISKYSYRYYNASNELRWAEVSSIFHIWENQPAVLAFISDVTERKIAEEEIKKLNEDLTASNEIIEAALYQKSALLEEISESREKLKATLASKDKFFSIISHDLKNPISALILGSDLIFQYYDKFSDAEIKQKIKQLSESSKFLFKLLENLLHWSRSQTGAIQYSPKNDNIVNIIDSSIELLKLNAQTKNIELKKKSPDNIICYFDEDMITTIIRNLISNAIKFTNEGGSVEIGAVTKPSEGLEPSEGYTLIYVKDSGIGMPPEILNKLFKIEENVTNKGTCGESGTGLGLILCKEFVEKHGGKIWVESEVGKGSAFWFSLPN